jgi:hypothetical protein
MVLYESGAKLSYVYFPLDSIISLLYVMEDGASADIVVTGCEGLVGIAFPPLTLCCLYGGQGHRQKWIKPIALVMIRVDSPLI